MRIFGWSINNYRWLKLRQTKRWSENHSKRTQRRFVRNWLNCNWTIWVLCRSQSQQMGRPKVTTNSSSDTDLQLPLSSHITDHIRWAWTTALAWHWTRPWCKWSRRRKHCTLKSSRPVLLNRRLASVVSCIRCWSTDSNLVMAMRLARTSPCQPSSHRSNVQCCRWVATLSLFRSSKKSVCVMCFVSHTSQFH